MKIEDQLPVREKRWFEKFKLAQAVWVAIVTGAFSLAAAYMNNNGKGEPVTNVYFLKITKVSVESKDQKFDSVRIALMIGENRIVYPVPVIWAKLTTRESSSFYPIYLPAKSGALNVSLLAKDDKGKIHDFDSGLACSMGNFDVSSLPDNQRISLCSGGATAEVSIEIRDKPF
ncbi:hypothetical protein [Dyadobacter jiangsuensis]|uniref:Uncharacterized protein n=1 Tax=Dyadobacter jiangsuensis TaxID=1591085 RepID=A0A2P8FP12_9BACT|nr:hypothetical protein [Dyadobacter jiangsuensis]PSL23462.1 hypothetical protein CLV60_11617 [Dyadobacter jiangsuensis]